VRPAVRSEIRAQGFDAAWQTSQKVCPAVGRGKRRLRAWRSNRRRFYTSHWIPADPGTPEREITGCPRAPHKWNATPEGHGHSIALRQAPVPFVWPRRQPSRPGASRSGHRRPGAHQGRMPNGAGSPAEAWKPRLRDRSASPADASATTRLGAPIERDWRRRLSEPSPLDFRSDGSSSGVHSGPRESLCLMTPGTGSGCGQVARCFGTVDWLSWRRESSFARHVFRGAAPADRQGPPRATISPRPRPPNLCTPFQVSETPRRWIRESNFNEKDDDRHYHASRHLGLLHGLAHL
jgi:hypothetical protein